MATLTSCVVLRDKQGNLHQFAPGDTPPEWAAKKITNPRVWDESPITVPGPDQQDGGGDEQPPLAGPGSGRDQWAAYAAQHGVVVDQDDKRDEIVAKLRKAGFRVE